METIIIVAIVALVFGSSVKSLIDRVLGTLDKSLDVADQYLTDVKAEQKQVSKLKREETALKHAERLSRLNAKRAEKGLPLVNGKDLGIDDI